MEDMLTKIDNAKGTHYSRSGNTDSFRTEMVNTGQNHLHGEKGLLLSCYLGLKRIWSLV